MTLQTSKGNSKIRIQYQKTNGQSHNRYTVRKNSLTNDINKERKKTPRKIREEHKKKKKKKNKVATHLLSLVVLHFCLGLVFHSHKSHEPMQNK